MSKKIDEPRDAKELLRWIYDNMDNAWLDIREKDGADDWVDETKAILSR